MNAHSISDYLAHASHQLVGLKGTMLAWLYSSGVGGLMAMTLPTDRPLALVLVIAVSGVAGAALAGWSKIISARAAARDSESVRRERETNSMISRLHDTYKLEVEMHRATARQYQQIAVLERKSKHRVQSEYNSITIHFSLLRERIKNASGEEPIPDFKIRTYHELVGEEDAAIERLVTNGGSGRTDLQQNKEFAAKNLTNAQSASAAADRAAEKEQQP